MPNSIMKEITFTPQIFSKNCIPSNSRKFEKLLNLLDGIADNGIIISMSQEWMGKVNYLIVQHEENDRSELQEVIKYLDVRRRIVFYNYSEKFENIEDNWIAHAIKLNKEREFDFIISSKETKKTKTIEQIARGALRNKGATVKKQSKDAMRDMLTPILGYAEIVKVIDPYFDLTQQRYKDALDVICITLGNHHGNKESEMIEIHTSLKPLMDNREFDFQKAKPWVSIIKNFEDKYHHSITIDLWEDIQKKDTWHDRWIITNQCGISIGKGTDVSDWTDSTWGLLSWDELPNISGKFNKNRDYNYTYIGRVTSQDIYTENVPKNVYIKRSDEEKKKIEEESNKKRKQDEEIRIKKLTNVKDFRKRK